jgi:hypothetical protein
LALFTTKQKAKDYEEESRLSTFSNFCGRGTHKQYRKKSLLSRFCCAAIEEYEEESFPIDPEL